MRSGRRCAVWLFLLLTAVSGAYTVPSFRSPAAGVEIGWPADRVPGARQRAVRPAEFQRRTQTVCERGITPAFPLQPERRFRCAIRGILYQRPPPFLSRG